MKAGQSGLPAPAPPVPRYCASIGAKAEALVTTAAKRGKK